MIHLKKQHFEFLKLVLVSIFIGITCAILGDALKMLTEKYESRFFALAESNVVYIFILPLIGLSSIYILRYYVFKKKENKGIKEILDSLETRHNELPIYKIPSHFINGILTVAFGGSSGIEVSTVVASASIGAVAKGKVKIHEIYRKELICSGVAAGVTALFGSPIAGLLFALEVIYKKLSPIAVISILISVCSAWVFNIFINSEPLFIIDIKDWNLSALPYFCLLGIFAALNSVYLTKTVLFFKSKFALLTKNYQKILLGSLILSISILMFPQLYGDGYHAMEHLFSETGAQISLTLAIIFLFILFLKPVVTATTLAAGGDGGIFGPSLFIGAFLGLLVSYMVNNLFNANTIAVNFMVIGMAAVLSASLHAPLTSVFLICGLLGNYTLIVPILIACIISKYIAKLILPYTVYTYATVNQIKQRT